MCVTLRRLIAERNSCRPRRARESQDLIYSSRPIRRLAASRLSAHISDKLSKRARRSMRPTLPACTTSSIMKINVPQSIICGDLPHNLRLVRAAASVRSQDAFRLWRDAAMLYCRNASVTIICRLIVSK